MKAMWTLAVREWIRFFRQRNRVIGALGQPILFWLLFGTGMHGAFRSGDQDFMTYFFPGTLALIVLFTAIFATISIIEDRKEGFLQNVLVAPVPRWTIACGKIIGGGAIAVAQAVLFLCLALLIGTLPFTANLLGAVTILIIASLALTAVGVCFAWPMESTQGYHAIMNLLLMPAWLLSGAFFPVPLPNGDSPFGQVVMHWIMKCNPMSYIVGGLRHYTSELASSDTVWTPSLGTCWTVTILFWVVASVLATMIVSGKSRRGAK